jgi:hypothetical protein
VSEGFHPQAAFVDGKLVGGSAMLSLELTVPGLSPARMGGVTSTGVIATHRRRGLLRAMMQAMIDEALERREPLAGLSASEGSIYGRFGFSPATLRTRWELDRTDAAFMDFDPPAGSLELVDASTAREAWPQVHEQARRARAGEITPPPGQWAGLSDEANRSTLGNSVIVHRHRWADALPRAPHPAGSHRRDRELPAPVVTPRRRHRNPSRRGLPSPQPRRLPGHVDAAGRLRPHPQDRSRPGPRTSHCAGCSATRPTRIIQRKSNV